MTTDESLTRLTVPDMHTVRAWVVRITALDIPSGTCTIDPNDGDLVTEVPFWGSAPPVGSTQVALLFDGLLGVISTGSGLTGVATANGISGDGSAASPVSAKNSGIYNTTYFGPEILSNGQPIYIDGAGNLRTQPVYFDAATAAKLATDLPITYPAGPSVMYISSAQATAGGWPAGGAVVLTNRYTSSVAIQHWYLSTKTVSAMSAQMRIGDNTAWSPWDQIMQDTGWVNITINSGFAQQAAEPPMCRKVDGIVYLKGGWSGTGITAGGSFVAGNIPAGYRPIQTLHFPAGTGSNNPATLSFFMCGSDGNVTIRPGTTVPPYYMFGGQSWPAYA